MPSPSLSRRVESQKIASLIEKLKVRIEGRQHAIEIVRRKGTRIGDPMSWNI
jgi:hypothetical protein